MSIVLSTPPAPPGEAAAHFAGKLAFETDVADVRADLLAETPGLIIVDTRDRAAWRQGHLPGAVHLPSTKIPARAAGTIPSGVVVVAYCWGPGCNGATRAALALANQGYRVKEMIGGYEYWVRAGFPVVTGDGGERQCAPDEVTTGSATVRYVC